MLAAFSTKNLKKNPSIRTESFQAVSPLTFHPNMPVVFLVNKKKAKQAGSSGKPVGEKAKSRPRGRGILNSLFSHLPHLRFKARLTTGSPSSGCEMIILQNKSHGKIIRVCVGIFFYDCSLE